MSQHQNHRNGLDCPTCDKGSRKGKKMVCQECYQRYVEEAAKALLKGSVISIIKWVMEKAENQLCDLQEKREKKQDEYTALQKRVDEEAYEDLVATLGNQRVVREVFQKALREKKKELWASADGNHLHFELKTLQSQTDAIESLLSELQVKADEYAERDSSSDGDAISEDEACEAELLAEDPIDDHVEKTETA